MSMSSNLMSQVLSLPVYERYQLAQQLLDSIDDASATELDQQFLVELERRHDEMTRGEVTVTDWRSALAEIETSLSSEKQD